MLLPTIFAFTSNICTLSPRLARDKAERACSLNLFPFTTTLGCPGINTLNSFTCSFKSKSKSSSTALIGNTPILSFGNLPSPIIPAILVTARGILLIRKSLEELKRCPSNSPVTVMVTSLPCARSFRESLS